MNNILYLKISTKTENTSKHLSVSDKSKYASFLAFCVIFRLKLILDCTIFVANLHGDCWENQDNVCK